MSALDFRGATCARLCRDVVRLPHTVDELHAFSLRIHACSAEAHSKSCSISCTYYGAMGILGLADTSRLQGSQNGLYLSIL